MVFEFRTEEFLEYTPMIKEAFFNTVSISLISAVCAFIVGVLMALGRQSSVKIVRYPAAVYVEFFRNTPLLIQIFIYYYGLPSLGLDISAYVCGILGLTFYTGAYITEVVRSGLQTIAKEQYEASNALGLSKFQTMWLVIFPQAFRIIIPPLGNQFINLKKNSSLVSFSTVVDTFYVAFRINVEF